MAVVVNTVRVSLGTALPAGSNVIGAVTQSGAWSVGITGTPTVTLGAGSASVGTVTVGNSTLAVTQSGTWNIGSITTLPALATGSNVIGAVTQSGTWNIGSITTLPALPTGSNTIGNVGVNGTVTVATHAVTQSGTWTVGVQGTGAADIGKAEDAAHTSGDTGIAVWGVRNDNAATSFVSANGDYTPHAVDAAGVQFVKSPYRPTPYKLNSAATTNATSVTATANTLLLGYYISNSNTSSWRYVKFYNKASAPTVGTDTPVLVLAIPAGGGANVSFPAGVNFSTGLAFATTTGAADSDTGAVALNEIIVNLVYATY